MYKIREHKDVTLNFSVKKQNQKKKNQLFKTAISVFRGKTRLWLQKAVNC